MELRKPQEVKEMRRVMFIRPHNISKDMISAIINSLSPLENNEDDDTVYAVWLTCGEKSDLFQSLENGIIELYPVDTFAKLLKNYLGWLVDRKEKMKIELEKRTPYDPVKNLPWIVIKEERVNLNRRSTLNCLPFYRIKDTSDFEKHPPHDRNFSKISYYEEFYNELIHEKNNAGTCFKILGKLDKKPVDGKDEKMYDEKYISERYITNMDSTFSKTRIVRECGICRLTKKYEGKPVYLFFRKYYELC